MNIYNEDCISGAKKYIADGSVDLMICDPPFGLSETSFDKQHYNRKANNIISGYVEAPPDYYRFTTEWMKEAYRVLKPNGSFYVFSGWTNLNHVLNALNEAGFVVINHIIWKYNFGVYTKKKFVSSHYHILYCKKSKKAKPYFNRNCRFQDDARTNKGRSMVYKDMEDVWTINKEYCPGAVKNVNKLPEALIEKIISYSSQEEDVVCDFFLGNFTTAIVSQRLNRRPCGFEINKESFDHYIDDVEIS